jgi:PAS domain S-box-containing protein
MTRVDRLRPSRVGGVRGVVLLAGAMFAIVFVARVAEDRVDAAVAALFALPIALLAAELGTAAGLAGAAMATMLLVVWIITTGTHIEVMGYVSRVGTFVLLGGLVGTLADRMRAAALEVERAQRRSELILESCGDAIYELRSDGMLAYVNPAGEVLTGREAADIVGKDPHATFHHSRLDGSPYPIADCPIGATLRDGRERHIDDEVFWTRRGDAIAVEYTASPMSTKDGVTGVVVIARDVSERREQQHRLRCYADQLMAADKSEESQAIRGAEDDGRHDDCFGESAVQATLEIAREHVGMDLAFLTEISNAGERVEVVAGDAAAFGLEAGLSVGLASGYYDRMITGMLSKAVADAPAYERVRDLPITKTAKIGSYIGVPVHLENGEIYGVLCCLSHAVGPYVEDGQVRFIELLASIVGVQIDHERAAQERRRLEGQRGRVDVEQSHVRTFLAALETHDEYTGGHSESVVHLAERVATKLDLTVEEVVEVKQTALLHDIGKVGVPDAILHKPDRLDELEWEIMRHHPAIGARLIASVEPLAHLAPAIRAEHERWDGSGYPDGLSGEEIPLAARIGLVCDAFHAMTSDRPYRPAMSHTAAIAELKRNAAKQFDPRVVDAFVQDLQPASHG